LPFLRLHTPVVAEGGQRTRIARVAIAMDGDVPRLLLELAHDEPADVASLVDEPSPTSTSPAFVPGVSARPPRPASTVPYDFAARRGPARVVTVSTPPPARTPPSARTAKRTPERWWSRFLRRLSSLVALLTRRTLPALPRG